MLKKIVTGVFICLTLGAYTQTDELNIKKYWKLRNSFRENFIKIGPLDGEGFPAASRNKLTCIDTDDYLGNGKGVIRWADGMIFQGHYIGFLATEYRLLKNQGEDVTATLNELYYALNAINRADARAEPIISGIIENGLPVVKEAALNGFYLRDDAPEDFHLKWKETPLNCRCLEGSRYINNNSNKVHNPADNLIASEATTAWSTPSLDQMTSLLVGITMIDKLLEDEIYVQPTPDDEIMNIKGEALSIANRLISYAYNHNWYLLDEWGWPVGNGGGDLVGTAYPITLIGTNLTGNDYSSIMTRQKRKYKVAQKYHSAPTEEIKDAIWDTLTFFEKNQVERFSTYNPWAENAPGLSNFESYQSEDEAMDISTNLLVGIWSDLVPTTMVNLYEDWETDHKLDDTAPFPINLIDFEEFPIEDYNYTIIFNLGVASGIFSPEQVFDFGVATDNYQLVLIHSLLTESEPVWGGRALFENLLNSMPEYGPFKFAAGDGEEKETVWSPNWGGEYKWNDPIESNSATGHEGQFNGLDYLYLHNLYYLVYGDELPEFEETYDCTCSSDLEEFESLSESGSVGVENSLDYIFATDIPVSVAMKDRLSLLDFCTPNTFANFPTNELSVPHDLKQLFDDYHAIGIQLNEFQTEEFAIKSGGELNIESRFIICNTKVLTVENGGVVNLDKGEIIIKPGAELIIEGEVNIEQYTNVIVEPEGKITIKNGGTLNNSGKIELKDGAEFVYEEGAVFRMRSDLAEMNLNGGNLLIKENAIFTFEAGATQSGQIRITSPESKILAENHTRIELEGNSDSDPLLVLEEGTEFKCLSIGLQWVSILNGKVILKKDTKFSSMQQFTANNVIFDSEVEVLDPVDVNRELHFYDETNISNAVFNNVSINAPLFYKNSGTFNMTLSEVNLNTSEKAIRVTGMGYRITQTTFNGFANYIIDGKNNTQPSRVTNCTFNGNLSTNGVIDNSNVLLSVEGCEFNNLYSGIHKINGKLDAKCNNFSNFKFAGIVAHHNVILDMSSDGYGGYNAFVKNSPSIGQNIALWNAQSILLGNGLNSFDDQGTLPIIKGTVQVGDIPALPVIPAHSNKWNVSDSPLVLSDFDVESTAGVNMLFMTSSPENMSCPIGGDWETDLGSFSPLGNNHGQIINTLHFANVPLHTAIDNCIRATKRFDDVNDNLIALELFEEVLITYPTMVSNPQTDWLIRLGSQHMKNTLYDAFDNGEISRLDNQTQFHSGVQSYVNVLNAITSIPITTANYEQQFYWEMDKMHLFHLIEKKQLANLILKNTEMCGLDAAEQSHVNHWKYQLAEEKAREVYGYEAEFKDTNWVDTTKFKTPIDQPFGGFSSTITSPNSVDLYNCNNVQRPVSTTNEEGINENTTSTFGQVHFSVYPNPNKGVFSVEYHMEEGAKGIILLHDAEGQEVYKTTCRGGNQYHVVNISELGAGTYFYSFIVNEKTKETGKVVLLK